jgi:lipoic acid synthetase
MLNSGDTQTESGRNVSRMPIWIRQQLGEGVHYGATLASVAGNKLHTVCEEARCPNRGECWSRGTATFMLLGDTCTRACGFCSVKTGRPLAVDQDEPRRIAEAVDQLGLRYVVLTSVNRDDQADKGVGIFSETLRALRTLDPAIGVEFLTPDFQGYQQQSVDHLQRILALTPFDNTDWPSLVWGHNVETVPGLYRIARKGSKYSRSLRLLELAGDLEGVETKSAIMLGLGEQEHEVVAVLNDLHNAGVSRVSIGQYLRPTIKHLPVAEYISPDAFAHYGDIARRIGFQWVKSGPLVRSSYHAEEIQRDLTGNK